MNMDKTIKCVVGSLAVVLFFILALTAWLAGCEPATCAYRAVVGAVITYVALSIAARLAIKVVLDEMINQRAEQLMHNETGPRG